MLSPVVYLMNGSCSLRSFLVRMIRCVAQLAIGATRTSGG